LPKNDQKKKKINKYNISWQSEETYSKFYKKFEYVKHERDLIGLEEV